MPLALCFCLLMMAGAVMPLRGSAAEGSGASEPLLSQLSKPDQVHTNSGPEELKKQVRFVVDTNALANAANSSTNAEPVKERRFNWDFRWEGWNGIYIGVTENRQLHGALAKFYEDPKLTNAQSWLRLEQTKMEGRLGGRIAVDGAAFATTGDLTGFDDGVELRRLYVFARGNCILLLPVSYEIQMGYVPGGFYLDKAFLEFQQMRYLGRLKFGQYQPPMSLAAMTSSRDITFMETAAPVQALAPGVSAGLNFGRTIFDQRGTWALGIFGEGAGNLDAGDASSDYGRAIGRMTGLPWYSMDEKDPSSQRLLHLGLSANFLYSASSSVRYKSRPESHLAPVVVDTGDIDAKNAMVADLEFAWVQGPLSVQAEFLSSFVGQADGSGALLHGAYGYVSWFITGESRPYDRNLGYFTRLVPRRDFSFGGGGPGAWEIYSRISRVDLNDGAINGGNMTLFANGITWYPQSHIRWKLNYIFGKVKDAPEEGTMNIFETRVEVDF